MNFEPAIITRKVTVNGQTIEANTHVSARPSNAQQGGVLVRTTAGTKWFPGFGPVRYL